MVETVRIEKIDPDLPDPYRAHAADAGVDLRSTISTTVQLGRPTVVPTGVRVFIPEGCVGLIHARSGLAARFGVSVLNSPGVIDPGYTGEVSVVLFTISAEPFEISRGDRIAQLVAYRTVPVPLKPTYGVERTDRGFGSTDVH